MPVRNTLIDLNNHLFEQLERLNDDSLSDEDLAKEINRSREISKIAQGIIANGNLLLRSAEFVDNAQNADVELPKLLGGGS